MSRKAAKAGMMVALAAAALLPPAAPAAPVANSEQLDAFVLSIQQHMSFDPELVRGMLEGAERLERVLELTDPYSAPSKRVYWREYRRRNVTPEMVADGVRFYRRNRQALERAQQRFGVPEEIIVAIIGIETRYGKVLGGFRVLDTLATLGFNHPTRNEFFLSELVALLVLADRGEINPLELEGSYAGAFGISQFLPGSFERYAIDFNSDGQRNLFYEEDAIGSVANFLVEHGWEAGKPVAFPAQEREALSLEPSVDPTHTIEAIERGGLDVDFGSAPPFEGPYAVVDLENLAGTEYRVGTVNYYALTRYNRSNKYAMAVFDLGTEIRGRLKGQ